LGGTKKIWGDIALECLSPRGYGLRLLDGWYFTGPTDSLLQI